VIKGTAGADNLGGGAGNETLNGLAGNDTLNGSAGNDTLNGGSGSDLLTGGIGSDSFLLADAPGATNIDRITDFAQGDRLLISRSAYTGLTLGAVSNSDITIGSAGNVSGLGVIGTLNASGTLGNQVQITAATTDGIAIASGDFDASGILGNSTSTITAGPNDGDVRGQVLAGGNVLASSTGNGTTGVDDATATISQSDLFGIRNIDIVGGQVGTN
jgi:hypothetical protein